MRIRVLGCSGSIAAGSRTTSFLIDDDLLVDAGTGVGDLTLDEMARVDHILVSHSHLDHVLAIGLLADSVMRLRDRHSRGPIRIHALPATIDALATHLFNGSIWPDFTHLPSAEHPMLAYEPFALGQRLAVAQHTVEVLPAEHTVPAVGFAIAAADTAGRHWVFTGDTGPNPALWQRLAAIDVAQLVIETAFSDDERVLARISRHLCPVALAAELAQLRPGVDVRLTHIKPGEVDAVMRQVHAHALAQRPQALRGGEIFELSGTGCLDASTAG